MEEFNPEGSGPHALTMHQPWASLLVHGIKRIEGRGWPTSFRGRLWIHAASKEPSPQTIAETEAMFTRVWAMEGIKPQFPVHYPCSALVGCVDIVDCLTVEQIEHWTHLPDSVKAEVGSAHGFLCENPKTLLVPQRMSGAQMIWSLPQKTAKQFEPALKQALQVSSEPWTWSKFTLPEHLRTARLRRSQNRHKWSNKYGTSCSDRRGTNDGQGAECSLRSQPTDRAVTRSASERSDSPALRDLYWPTATKLEPQTGSNTVATSKAALTIQPAVPNVWAARLAAQELSTFGGVTRQANPPFLLQPSAATPAPSLAFGAPKPAPQPSLGVGELLASRRSEFLPLLQPSLPFPEATASSPDPGPVEPGILPSQVLLPTGLPVFAQEEAAGDSSSLTAIREHTLPDSSVPVSSVLLSSAPIPLPSPSTSAWGIAASPIPQSSLPASSLKHTADSSPAVPSPPRPASQVGAPKGPSPLGFLPPPQHTPQPSFPPTPPGFALSSASSSRPSSTPILQPAQSSSAPSVAILPSLTSEELPAVPATTSTMPACSTEHRRSQLLHTTCALTESGHSSQPKMLPPAPPRQHLSPLSQPSKQQWTEFRPQQRWTEFRPQQRWTEFRPQEGSWITDKQNALQEVRKMTRIPAHLSPSGAFTALLDPESSTDECKPPPSYHMSLR